MVLGRHLRIAPAEVPIEEGPFGKPVLKSGAPYFNLSHTQDLVAVVVREAGPVGIDIESTQRRTPRSEVMRRTLTEAEQQELKGLSAEGVKTAFLSFWCRKEAYAKGLSIGLGLNFKRIHVGSGDMVIAGDPPWEVRSLLLSPPHIGAVAASGQGWLVKTNPISW
jgi:4'-phosphopantetheinyl transferase